MEYPDVSKLEGALALKILYIINNIDWFWSHRLPLALAAKDAGYGVIVAASHVDEAQKQKLAAHGFEGVCLPPADTIISPFTVLRNIKAIYDVLKTHKPDILHVITIKYAFLAGLAARSCPRLKVVHTIAGLGYLFSGNDLKPRLLRLIAGLPLKLALSRAELIFQNPDDRDLMIERDFADKAHSHLIRGSGVDINEFSYSPPPEDGKPLVLMATRLLHDKGVAVFIEAAKIIGDKARFQIAGGEVTSNPLAITKDQMEAMIKDSPVEWLGRVADMPALIRQSAVFVYPSYYREGIPKVLLEAASIGRAIVTTDHPGCREAVEDGVNGFLVPIKDPNATAQATLKLLQDPALRDSMGKASRRRAEDEFNVERIVTETLGVYKIFQ